MQIVPSAMREIQVFRAYYQRQIADAIDCQLHDQPTVSARHRKSLPITEASFAFEPPLWELRVGDIRVFYDIDEQRQTVYVRAVRDKPPHATTEDVL